MAEPTAAKAPPWPRCRHLAGKAMYYQLIDTPDPWDPPEEPGILSDGGTWWCTRTCSQLGPDTEPADREACAPGRGCYEPDALG